MRSMRLGRRALVVGAVAVTVLGTAATSVGAATRSRKGSASRHGTVVSSTLIGRPTATSLTVPIRGVQPGGVAWTLSRGKTRVTGSGRVSVHVEGLVITGTNTNLDGTTGPVTKVVASLTCEGMTPTVVSTAAVPLSPGGDAKEVVPVVVEVEVAVPRPEPAFW